MPSTITPKFSSNAKAWGVPTGKRSAIPRSSSAPRVPLANKPLNISSPILKPTVAGLNLEKKLPGTGTPSRLPRAKSGPVSMVPSRRSSPPPRPPRAPARLSSLPLTTRATTTTPPKPLSKDFTSSRTLSAKKVLTPIPRSASSTSLRTPAKPPLSRDFFSSRTLSATKLLSTPTTSSRAAPSYDQPAGGSIVSRARTSVSPPSSGTRPRSPISRASSSSPPARELKFAARLRADRSAHAVKPIAADTEPTSIPKIQSCKAPEPISVREERKVEMKEEKIKLVINVEEKKPKVEEIKETVVEEIKKINVEESKHSKIVEIKKINVEETKPSIIEEIKKTQYSIVQDGEKKSEEEKITEGLRSWTPDAAVPESMVVTELVQTTHGVVRVQRYIIAEEEEEVKPRVVVRSKWWSFGMLGSRKSCH